MDTICTFNKWMLCRVLLTYVGFFSFLLFSFSFSKFRCPFDCSMSPIRIYIDPSTMHDNNKKTELPSTKLHTLLLDHHNMKLTWYIDWPKKEVLFNIDDAFSDESDWFSFGFSQRGHIEGSDVCFFVRNIYDESYNEAIVSKHTTIISNGLSAKNRLQFCSRFLPPPITMCL